jgi:hypothetical protein
MITTTYDESSLPWSYSTFANLPLQDVQSPKILARFLNKKYRIKVKATGYGRKGTGEARILFLTNMEPYDGNCITLPDTGKFDTTLCDKIGHRLAAVSVIVSGLA